jgi:hypothetical protein
MLPAAVYQGPAAATRLRKCDPMRAVCQLSLAVASLALLSVVPSLAQSLAVPCSAFSRNADGGWKVLAPVMLDIDGRLLGPLVGSTFAPGRATNGIKVSEVLDRECR